MKTKAQMLIEAINELEKNGINQITLQLRTCLGQIKGYSDYRPTKEYFVKALGEY